MGKKASREVYKLSKIFKKVRKRCLYFVLIRFDVVKRRSLKVQAHGNLHFFCFLKILSSFLLLDNQTQLPASLSFHGSIFLSASDEVG